MKCNWCDCEMDDKSISTCLGNKLLVLPDGSQYRSIAFQSPTGGRCPDCNVADGGYHHPGCDQEVCPICGGQMIACGCLEAMFT